MNRLGAAEPRQLGPFRLVGRLPDGTLGGPVYLGTGPGGVRTAVTLLPEALAQDLRFKADVGSALALSGPGLVPLLGAELSGPTPWLADAFTPAVTLRQAVEQYGPLPRPSLSVLAPGLAQALATVHATGFAYGALTPGAVLLAVHAPILAARVSGAAAQADDVSDLAAVLEFAAGGYLAPASVLLPLLREAVEEFRSRPGPDPVERPAARRLVELFGDPAAAAPAGGWLPAPVAAAAAAVGKAPGISRRALFAGAAGGAVAVGGLATLLAWPSGSGQGAAGGAATPGESQSASAGSASAGSASAGSPSPTGEVRIELTGTQPATAWQIVLQDVPCDLAASETVVALTSEKSTLFVDRAGKPAYEPHSLSMFPSTGLSRMTFANGKFYVLGEVRDQGSAVVAMDAATGKPVWGTKLAFFSEGRPADVAATADTVYVSAGKYSTGDDNTYTGVLTAYDAATGDVRWKISGTDLSNVLVPPTGHLLLAASAVAKPDGQVVMLDAAANGARGWKQTVSNGRWYFQPGHAMTCYAGGLFVYGADRVIAADPATGKQVWDLRADEDQPEVRFGTPFAAPDGATVYVPVGQDLVALDAKDGRVKWMAVLPPHVLWTAGLSLDGVHARCTADTVLATDSKQNLWAIDAATGRARWTYNDPAAPASGFRWTVGGDRVYISSNLTLTAIATHG